MTELTPDDIGAALDSLGRRDEREPKVLGPDDYAAALDAEDMDRARASLYSTQDLNPDQFAADKKAAERLGVPQAAVSAKRDEAMSVINTDDIMKALDADPKLRSAFGDPSFAAVAKDDIGILSRLGNLFDLGYWKGYASDLAQSLKVGDEQVALGRVAERLWNGTATEEELRWAKDAKKRAALLQERTDNRNFLTAIPLMGVQQAPVTGHITSEAAPYAAAGMATGATIGTAVPVVGQAAGAMAGLQGGMIVGTATAAGRMEMHLAYMDFLEMKDTNGQPLDPGLARLAAQAVGVLNGAAEVVPTLALIKTIPGIGPVVAARMQARAARQMVEQALLKPTFRTALMNFGKRIAEVGIKEAGTEFAQEMFKDIAGASAQAVQSRDTAPLGGDFWSEGLDRWLSAGKGGLQAGIGLALPGSIVSFGIDVRKAREAERRQEFFDGLSDGSKESKLLKRDSAAFERWLASRAGEGADTVYIPADKFTTFFQNENVDPFALTDELGLERKDVQTAIDTGGDIAIPIEKFASRLAPSDYYAGLRGDIRLAPDEMTLNEAILFQQNIDGNLAKEVERLAEEANRRPDEQTIYDDVNTKLRQAGVSKNEAENIARLIMTEAVISANMDGTSPMEMYQRFPLEFRQDIAPGLRMRPGADIGEDAIFEAVRTGKRMPTSERYGPSLIEFIAERGGLLDIGGEGAFVGLKDWHKAKPGRKRALIEDTAAGQGNIAGIGRDLTKAPDDVTMAAWEAGYFPDFPDRPTPDVLLRAIADELAGNPRYSEQWTNQTDQTAAARDDAADQIAEALDRAGLSPSNMSIDEIRDFVRQERTAAARRGEGEVPGVSFEQAAIPKKSDRRIAAGNAHGLMPHLRDYAPGKPRRSKKDAVVQKTNNKNARKELAKVDEILAMNPEAHTSVEAWLQMLADAYGVRDVPMAPRRFISEINGDGIIENLSRLTPGQIADADHGFENAANYRKAYISGNLDVKTTAKLFMWSFLSRGVSPYTQEALFIDAFKGIEPWLELAGKGAFDFDGSTLNIDLGSPAEVKRKEAAITAANIARWEDENKRRAKGKQRPPPKPNDFSFRYNDDGTVNVTFTEWARSVSPAGAGQPGAGATHNLNAFGRDFLVRMSQDVGDGTGRSRLQYIHDLMSDKNATGKMIRREFAALGEGVGIDNKVVSFTLLVAGFEDVMVIDRVQMRQLYNDGSLGDLNIYDGLTNSSGAAITGSSFAKQSDGARGILIYEAIERGIEARIGEIYKALGREGEGSVGRYHWETWVADSQQEASHGTLAAILPSALGDADAIHNVTAKQGEYGSYTYGTRYGVDGSGVSYFTYQTPRGNVWQFTVPQFVEFQTQLKKPSSGVVPAKFKVKESGNAPWYARKEVNTEALDALAERLSSGRARDDGAGTLRGAGAGQAVPNRLAAGGSSFEQSARKGRVSVKEPPRRGPDGLETEDEVRAALKEIHGDGAVFRYSQPLAAQEKYIAEDGKVRRKKFSRSTGEVYVASDGSLFRMSGDTLERIADSDRASVESDSLRELANIRLANRQYMSRFDEEIRALAERLAEVGLDVELSFPEDSSSRYAVVSDGAKDIKVRIADHPQPMGWRKNRVTGKDQFLPVGGFSRTAGVRHEPSDISADPSTGIKVDDLFDLVVDAFRSGATFEQSPFYSPTLRAASDLTQAKGTGEQMLAMLKKGGAKDEEIAWIGLDEFLKGKKSVTRDEIMDFISANQVEVKDVGLDGVREVDGGMYVVFDAEGREYGPYETRGHAQDIADELDGGTGASRFAEYTLPGGKNYTELLLTIPETGNRVDRAEYVALIRRRDEEIHRDGEMSQETRSALRAMREQTMAARAADYESSHFPGVNNILAHVRFKEREVDGKRVLHIEEIQSDWHQQGRKNGYAPDPTALPLVAHVNTSANEPYYEVRTDRGVFVANIVDIPVEPGNEAAAVDAARGILVQRGIPGTVPDAPFKRTWHEMAFRRMAAYAVENGFDEIAWTPGKEQADRYDLSREISEIHLSGSNFKAYDHYGDMVLSRTGVTPEDLPELIGKEAAERLMAVEPKNGVRSLEGQDLRVGGEGMVAFYDKMLVNYANKFGKKFGAKVSVVEIETGPGSRRFQIYDDAGVIDEIFDPRDIDRVVAKYEQINGSPVRVRELGVADTSELWSLPVTDKMRDSIAQEGVPLFQSARGNVAFPGNFGSGGRSIITMFEGKRDMSTLLHEVGHFFVEKMRFRAQQPGAPERLVADYEAMKKWWKDSADDLVKEKGAEGITAADVAAFIDGGTTGSAETDAKVNRAIHEYSARGFEVYLSEGKAPSIELEGAFSRFRAWLLNVYKNVVKRLGVNLTPEVKRVFDRMLATDDQIAAAEATSMFVPLLDGKDDTLTEAERKAYFDSATRATAAAQNDLDRRKIYEERQRLSAERAEQRAGIENDVSDELSTDKAYIVWEWLRTGEMINGEAAPDIDHGLLDRKALIDDYGDAVVRLLPKGRARIDTRTGGIDPSIVAEAFGFRSAHEMLNAIYGKGEANFAKAVQEETQRRMDERHGPDASVTGEAEEKAIAASHNNARAEFLYAELQMLVRKASRVKYQGRTYEVGDIPPAQIMRAAAARAIRERKVEDAKPHTYYAAERRAGREATEAVIAGDFAKAIAAQQKRLLNHYMAIEAQKAREEVEKMREYFRKFSRPSVQARIEKGYREQIDALLSKYEFGMSLSRHEDAERLREFVEARRAAGEEVDIDPALYERADAKHWRNATVEELRGLNDAVKNIEHVARLKNKLMLNKKQRDFDAVKEELLGRLEGIKPLKARKANTPTGGDVAMTRLRELDASLLKVEQILDWLDGQAPDGPWKEYLFQTIAAAEVEENDLNRQVTAKLVALMDAVPISERNKWTVNFDLPELPSDGRQWSKENLISMALNMGNEDNFAKMVNGARANGWGWSEQMLKDVVFRHLSKSEMDFVQSVWDLLDEFWPQIEKMEERLKGIAPDRVEAKAIETPRGTYRGGYYPLVYDGKESATAADIQSLDLDKLFVGGYQKATTKKSHTMNRVDGVKLPVLFQLSVIPNHLTQVIHDLTHREAVMSVHKILKDREVSAALYKVIGKERHDAMVKWVQAVANDSIPDTQGVTFWSRLANATRTNTAIVAMGFKATTMMSQFAGFGPSIELLMGKDGKGRAHYWMRKATLNTLRHPVEAWQMVAQKSGEMRNRFDNVERDIRESQRRLMQNRKLGSRAATARRDVQMFAFYGIGIADRMVTVPTWLAAYNQAITDHKLPEEKAIAYADRVVRLSQGSGSVKDLAAVQRRGNDFLRLITMFYSPFSAAYARYRSLGRAVRDGDIGAVGVISKAFWMVFVPAVVSELLAGRGPEDDEDWATWAALKTFAYPLMSIPGFRDIASTAIEQKFGYRLSPVNSVGDTLANSVKGLTKLADGDSDYGATDAIGDTAMTLGYIFGLPTAQARITVGNLWDVFTGEDDFRLGDVFFHKPKK